jgi:hypothetical protein
VIYQVIQLLSTLVYQTSSSRKCSRESEGRLPWSRFPEGSGPLLLETISPSIYLLLACSGGNFPIDSNKCLSKTQARSIYGKSSARKAPILWLIVMVSMRVSAFRLRRFFRRFSTRKYVLLLSNAASSCLLKNRVDIEHVHHAAPIFQSPNDGAQSELRVVIITIENVRRSYFKYP